MLSFSRMYSWIARYRLPFAVAEVVAFVDQHERDSGAVSGSSRDDAADRQHLGAQPVLLTVVLPHRHEVLRADDERFQVVVVLENRGQRRRHQRLAEADHVADQNAAALVQVMGGDLDRGDLELEELVAEVAGNAELGQAGAGLLGKVVGHLQVDVVGRSVSSRAQLSSMISTSSSEMSRHQRSFQRSSNQLGQFLAGVVVEDIDVQLALVGQAGRGEIAAAEKADDGLFGSGRKSR